MPKEYICIYIDTFIELELIKLSQKVHIKFNKTRFNIILSANYHA